MKDILSYESDIWSCADLLISSGIKQSKFPDYMMPFFALIMLEGRMRNEMADIEASEGLTRENNLQEFIEAFRDRECGYNDYIVREGKTLSTICNNDKTFEQDFRSYLAGFDGTLKELLGIERGTDDSKYLNLDGMVAELRKKGILMQYITQWSQIDLNGAEDIKRWVRSEKLQGQSDVCHCRFYICHSPVVLPLPQSYLVKPFATIPKNMPRPCRHWLTGRYISK